MNVQVTGSNLKLAPSKNETLKQLIVEGYILETNENRFYLVVCTDRGQVLLEITEGGINTRGYSINSYSDNLRHKEKRNKDIIRIHEPKVIFGQDYNEVDYTKLVTICEVN